MSERMQYKGMRTFPPNEHQRLDQVLKSWNAAAKNYGYKQYKTPLLDPLSLYEGKTSREILAEQTYTLTDRGGREAIIRPEITPGLAAMIVSLQQGRMMRKPCKVFSIGSVFRYEKPQRGRTREHIQFNLDIFGESGVWAEAEIIELVFAVFRNLDLPAEKFLVKMNDRRDLQEKLAKNGVANAKMQEVLRVLDKKEKMSDEVFQREFEEHAGIRFEQVQAQLETEPPTITSLRSFLSPEIRAEYTPTVVRGFDYYTGIVFEIYADDPEFSRSIAGGGRYDSLIQAYGGEELPAVGMGMGDVLLLELLKTYGKRRSAKDAPPAVWLYTTSENTAGAFAVAREIRENGKTQLPVSFVGTIPKKKVADLYKRAEREGARHVLGISGTGEMSLRVLDKRETIAVSSSADVMDAILL